MRVAAADDVGIRDVVVFAKQKAVDVARGDSERADHHGHGRGEVRAVAGAAAEQKVGERVFRWRVRLRERVTEAAAQVHLNGGSLIECGYVALGDLAREARDTGINRRKLEIGF